MWTILDFFERYQDGAFGCHQMERGALRLAKSFSCRCFSLFILYLESESSSVSTLPVNLGLEKGSKPKVLEDLVRA